MKNIIKVLIFIGTRPEAIKMAPVYKSLMARDTIEVRICSTGQHKEMLAQVFDFFEIQPDYDLDIMTENQTLHDVVSKLIILGREVISDFKPDLVLVHGDTATTIAISLSSFLMTVPVGHVEAGLRSHDIKLPFPEELNRRVSTLCSDIHFAPTVESEGNLISEGISSDKICVTGNTVIDSLYLALEKLKSDADFKSRLENTLQFDTEKKFVLITGHRRENFGSGLENICDAIVELAINYRNVNFVYPVHMNPNVSSVVRDKLGGHENIILLYPLNYQSFVYLMSKSHLILTDSGGIQEEGPSLGKPVLVMRSSTERPEAVAAGTVKLVGTRSQNIVKEVELLIEDPIEYKKMSSARNPYGLGDAAKKITDWIEMEFKNE